MPSMSRFVRGMGPGSFAVLDVVWLAVLLFLAYVRINSWHGPVYIEHDPVGGLIWLVVPWAGALGGVTISLVGVCRHGDSWQAKWNYWHIFRPVLGAIFGVLGILVLALILGGISGIGNDTEFENP